MKASPPPEPPPPPPGEVAPPSPDVSANGQPAPPPAPDTTAPARWPEWFSAVDLALVLVVLALGFLAGSFAARNSDVWLHLASGRALAEGRASPGTDPFSYAGANRPWVQVSWLFDLGLYAIYSIDSSGAAAVGLKAVMLAASFGLLFLLRRRGHALWPWAVLVGLGLLASAPTALLRSSMVSTLFLAATLVLVYRLPWKERGWREPAIVAALILLWTNLDGWSLLGPLTLALVTVGEYLNRFFGRDETPPDVNPFFPAPPRTALLRALGLGVVAFLLNPMFLAAVVKDPAEAFVQLLPVELGIGIPASVFEDTELAGLLLSPWAEEYRKSASLGYSLSGLSFLLLLLVSLVAMGAGFSRLRATHIILWFVFAGLAFHHVRMIPFFAIVAIPLAAGHINGLSSMIRLGPAGEPATRVLLTGSGLGRVLSLFAALAAAVAAYPGWIHPQGDPAFVKRVEWSIDPDPGLVRAARTLQSWRSDGTLPDDVRGLAVSTEFANYCAWYAPGEKVFVNGRYVFHRHELPDLLTVRQQVVGRRGRLSEEATDVGEVLRVCDDHAAGYLVVTLASRHGGSPALIVRNVFTFLNAEDRWKVWHLDGRSAVLGRPDAVPSGRRAPEFDPVRLAFGPDQELVPNGTTVPLPVPPESFLDEYAAQPRPVPPDADDAVVLGDYAQLLAIQAELRWRQQTGLKQSARAAVAGVGMALMVVDNQPTEDDQFALPVLMTRSARRAVLAAPDRPEGYFSLSLGYRHPLGPASDQSLLPPSMAVPELQLQLITALARYLARVPPPTPEACTEELAKRILEESFRLASLYRQTGQLDMCRDAMRKAVLYARLIRPEELQKLSRAGPKDEPLKRLQGQEDELNRQVDQRSDRVERQTSPRARFLEAQRQQLPGLAIKIFKDADPKDFGTDSLSVALTMIALELAAGRLEDAATDLSVLEDSLKDDAAAEARGRFGPAVRDLQSVQYRLEGNFTALEQALNQGGTPTVPPDQVRVLGNLQAVFLGATAISGPVAGLPGAALPATAGLPPRLPLDSFLVLQQMLLGEAMYQYDRALVALVQGNIAEAKRRFELAARPQGAELDRIGDPSRLGRILRYLHLIRQAESTPKN